MCHEGGAAKLGLDLSSPTRAYAGLVGVDAEQCNTAKSRVAAGNAAGSYLINKLTGVGMCSGSIMPKADGALSQAQLDTIRAWIATGALDD